MSAAGSPSSAQDAAAVITEISLERRCGGCDREAKLTLRRDGTATKIQFGHARLGTADRVTTGSLSQAAFSELAQRVVAEHFFDLRDEYRDPQVADGDWTVTTVTTGERWKTVTARAGMEPTALTRIEARVDELASAIAWRA